MKLATGSHSGTGVWLLQRATAVLLTVALPVLLVLFLLAMPRDFAAWHAVLAPVWVRIVLLLTGASLALHAWVGMRDMFMDYVHSVGARLTLLLAVITVLSACVVWLAAVLFATPLWSGA
ncbi:MAG: succinate dehydrogenase, hydrophobic membrane anchor protein [Thiobacillus sp.]|nr:succinate dehydrogenase, hydrophobic membrane anchor protein [Thiobacillus sp.]